MYKADAFIQALMTSLIGLFPNIINSINLLDSLHNVNQMNVKLGSIRIKPGQLNVGQVRLNSD